MPRLDGLKEKILTATANGEILLLIPPFVVSYNTLLEPQLLQARVQEKGYKVDILYLSRLNIHNKENASDHLNWAPQEKPGTIIAFRYIPSLLPIIIYSWNSRKKKE